MNNRNAILVLLFLTVLCEGVLLSHSGLGDWLTAGSHSADEWRSLLMDWRVAMSVGLVTIILWLVYSWFRLGSVHKNPRTKD